MKMELTDDVEVVEVDEFQFGRVGDKAGVEDRLQDLLPGGKSREVTVAFQPGGQPRRGEGSRGSRMRSTRRLTMSL